MPNPKPSTVIHACLTQDNGLKHNEQRIANWYNHEMEVQIMVAQGTGDSVDGKTGVYTDGLNTWYNLRIPKNANADPIDNDHEIKYALELHAEAIGMTGWNWKRRCSVRVGFDFDSITCHAKGVGISDEQLNEIRDKLMDVPEALVLRSTSGTGLHVYLEFDPDNLPATLNHTEHAAIAIACLKIISHRVGFDFQAGVDVGGGNMWIWHRKMTPENRGLTILKDNIQLDGKRAYMAIPENWKLYMDVATRKRQKIKIEGVPDSEQDDVSNKAASQKAIPLTDTHKQIITGLQQVCPNFSTIWVPDHHLLQTHTAALKIYFNQCKNTDKPLIGVFHTISEGRNPQTPNCFCFPLDGGGFKVVRFGKGTKEHDSWQMDRGGWSYTYYNKAMNFFRAATAYEGLEDDRAGFTFTDATAAISAVQAMGHQIEIPDELYDRAVTLRPHKGGKLLVEIESVKTDKEFEIIGWIKKRSKWIKVYNIKILEDPSTTVDFEDVDGNVRAVITTDHLLSGWYLRHEQGMWMQLGKDDARSKLKSIGYDTTTEAILGQVISKAWIRVNLPFREEYPGNRQWNLNAAQLRFDPATDIDNDGESLHPYWDMILTHIGRELDDYLIELPWAKRNGIRTGKDYLMLWIACMIREPFEPLPYLFLYGLEETGKSILHEAISLLMTKGVIRADTALTNQSDFNGELAGAILCVIEEKNISKAGVSVRDKIKDWVTSPTISIHAKHKQVCQQRNSTHWIQCSNDKSSCPIFTGDTRITMINVAELIPGSEVPKLVLLSKLEEEAPYFLATILNATLPDLEHRMRLPIVVTSNKEQMADSNQTLLEEFLETKCFYAPGSCILFTDFYNEFIATIPDKDIQSEWDRQKIQKSLPGKYPLGFYTGNARYIGNISFIPTEAQPFIFVCRDKKLITKKCEA
jgi:hypothetical protein